MKRIAVYQRVSTDQQSTDMQRLAIEEWLAAHEPTAQVTWFTDHGISGKRDNRPEFNKLKAAVTEREIDAVVTYRLDRLSRNAVSALKLLLDWLPLGIEFFPISQPAMMLGKDAPFRLTIVSMFAELAQMEAAVLSERTKAGMKAAKARGKQIGASRSISEGIIAEAKALRESGASLREISRRLNISHESIRRYV